MGEQSQNDIRRLLKMFGVQTDEAVMAHLARTPGSGSLRVRLVLEDLTDYGGSPPDEPLRVTFEGEVRR